MDNNFVLISQSVEEKIIEENNTLTNKWPSLIAKKIPVYVEKSLIGLTPAYV